MTAETRRIRGQVRRAEVALAEGRRLIAEHMLGTLYIDAIGYDPFTEGATAAEVIQTLRDWCDEVDAS